MSNEQGAPRWWPTTPYDFVDLSKCPSCFAALGPAPVCGTCGLALSDPRIAALRGTGQRILDAENARQMILGAMRAAQASSAPAAPATVAPSFAQVAAAAGPAVPVAPSGALPPELVGAAVPQAAAQTAPAQTAPAPTASAQTAPAPAAQGPAASASPSSPGSAPVGPLSGASHPPLAPAKPRRRLTVPVLLLIVGVSLVSVAAIFFLTLAWFFSSIAVRAVIIAGVTLATMALAWFLRRRGLTAAAEGIAVIGIVLIALDVWAVRANDLFGTGQLRPALYAGVGVLVAGAICRAWSMLSRLRAPDFAAVLALPTGLGLLVAGIADADALGAVTAGLLGASLGGLAHRLPAPVSSARAAGDAVVERAILAVIGTVTLGAAAITAWFAAPGSLWPGTVLTPLVIVLAGAHAVALLRTVGDPLPYSRTLVGSSAVVGTIAAATAGWQLATRSDASVLDDFLAPVLAVAVPVALAHVKRATARDIWLAPALLGAAAVGGLSVLITAGVWLLEGSRGASRWVSWQTPPFSPGEIPVWVCAAAVALAALVMLVPARIPFVRIARPPLAAVLVLLGAFASGVPAVLVIVGVLIAAAAVAALGRAGEHRALLLPGWLAAGILGAVVAYAAGHTDPWLWIAGAAAAIAFPVALAGVLRPAGRALVVVSLAPVVAAAIATLSAPGALSTSLSLPSSGAAAVFLLLQWLAVVVLATGCFAPLGELARRTLGAAGVVLAGLGHIPLLFALLGTGLSVVPGTIQDVIDNPIAGVVRVAATVALLLLVALRHRSWFGALAAGLVAPALAPAVLIAVALAARLPADRAAVPTDRVMTQLAPPGGAVAIIVAAVLVVIAAAVLGMRDDRRSTARWSAEVGAATTALLASWWTPASQTWLLWAALAVGFAAASVSRGWRNPVPRPVVEQLPTAASPAAVPLPAGAKPPVGMPLRWRRLLAWPAVISLALSWSAALSEYAAEASVDLRLIPIAALFALFCAALVWLRRSAEASVAIVLSFGVGLALLGLADRHIPGPRGIIVMLVASALALALTWSPTRRIRNVAAAGATTAIAAIAAIAITRAFGVPADVPAEPAARTAWLLLVVAVAYLSGVGAARPPLRPGPFAHVVPPTTLGLAVLTLLLVQRDVVVDAAALGTLAVVHLLSALWHRAPFAAASRWTSLGGALLLAASALLRSYEPIEAVTLPVAALTLLGAAAAIFRHTRAGTSGPRTELGTWLGGLALAILPSLAAPVTDARTWIVVGAGVVLAAGVAFVRHPLALPSAFALSGGALLMGTRVLAGAEGGETAAAVAGVGAVAFGAVLVWRRAALTPGQLLVVPILGAVLTAAAAWVGSEGDLGPTIVIATAAAGTGVLGAWLLRPVAWAGYGSVLTIGGGVTLLLVALRRFGEVTTLGPASEAALWPLVCFVALAGIGSVAFLRAQDGRIRRLASGVVALGAVVLALGELAAVPVLPEIGAQSMALLTVTVLTALAAAAFALRGTIGQLLWITAAAAGAVFALWALGVSGVRPVELLTAAPALGALVLGARRLRRDSAARSWPALGPGLALLTIPSLLHDLGPSALWRVVALGVVAVGLVVFGATRRLQAPLVLGSAVALVHGVAQLWPWIAAGYTAVPWWLWAGLAGALLIYIAVRYEKQKVALQKAFVAVTALR